MKYVWVGEHSHRHGTSVYVFSEDSDMSEERFAEFLGDEYEPELDEILSVSLVEIQNI